MKPLQEPGPEHFPSLSTIEALLRIYWSPVEPHDDSGNFARAVAWLRQHGLIDVCSPRNESEGASCWTVTERGQVWIEHIRGIALPVAVTVWTVRPNPSK